MVIRVERNKSGGAGLGQPDLRTLRLNVERHGIALMRLVLRDRAAAEQLHGLLVAAGAYLVALDAGDGVD